MLCTQLCHREYRTVVATKSQVILFPGDTDTTGLNFNDTQIDGTSTELLFLSNLSQEPSWDCSIVCGCLQRSAKTTPVDAMSEACQQRCPNAQLYFLAGCSSRLLEYSATSQLEVQSTTLHLITTVTTVVAKNNNGYPVEVHVRPELCQSTRLPR